MEENDDTVFKVIHKNVKFDFFKTESGNIGITISNCNNFQSVDLFINPITLEFWGVNSLNSI